MAVKRVKRKKGVRRLKLIGIGHRGYMRKTVLAHGSRWRGRDSFAFQKDANVDLSIDIILSLPSGSVCTIDWGDEVSSVVTGPQTETTYNHVYASAALDYRIELSGDIDTITYFKCSDEPISGNVGNWQSLTSLTYLSLGSTSVTGDIANLSGLTSLTYLHLYSTSVDTYTQGTLPDWDACVISIQNLGLSQQEVDDFLCDLDTSSSASTKTLNISGTNSAPSATGLTCKTSLEGKGWTVTVST